MGRKKPTSQIYAQAISYGQPEALERDIVKDQQTRFDEETILWGDLDDSLPIRILQAVNQSPTTTSCLGKVADYMQGTAFTDKGLMQMPVDADGTSLWDFHARLCDYMAKLEAFSVRFILSRDGSINQSYVIGTESCRFVKPSHTQSRKISKLKYNPYWGTSLWSNNDSKTYDLWEPKADLRYDLINQAIEKGEGASYGGQVYFFGNPRAPYKFYPVPKYWSGKEWIYIDGQTQTFTKKLLDNGFFESVMIKMVGDPNQKSQNPKYQKRVTGTDGTVRMESDGTTVGQEFSEMMSKSFSGADKAGKAMVLWALNKDVVPTVEPFPTNTNFDNLTGTMNNAIRGIAIATEVQAILANLPQQSSSLGSDGESMRMAVELMQARVREPQVTLEQFYNTVLLPNMTERTGARVKIVNHTPLSNQIQVPDKVWEWMNDTEKAAFVKAHIPAVTVDAARAAQASTALPQPAGQEIAPETAQAQPQVNEALKGLKLSDINKLSSIVAKVAKGAVTYDQAKIILQGYGLSDEQIDAWLVKPEEI
jgi:hypothetical protein